jgi:type VI secretion system protein ImpF
MSVFLPCLLERWSSGLGTQERNRTVNSWQDVRKDVMRNLEWLLNTEQPRTIAGVEPPPAVERSVLFYGVMPYSGKVRSSFNADDVAWSIRERIIAYEPRIEPASLTVTPTGSPDKASFNRMRFTIEGFLRSDPLPIEFVVHSELDLESGKALIST